MLKNNIESVKSWVKKYDGNKKDRDVIKVLYDACQNQNVKPEIVQYLLKESQLMQTGQACVEFINVFIEEGNRAALKRLLQASCVIDHRVLTLVLSHGLTHDYPQHFYNDIFNKLDNRLGKMQLSDTEILSKLEKILKKNFNGKLLLKACMEQNTTLEAIKSLIKNKADVNFQGENDETPLHAACKQKDINPAIIKLLVNSGADLEMEDSRYRTPFFLACEEHAEKSNPAELIDIIKLFINLKADINTQDEDGVTLLDLFADWGDRCLEVIKFLFENGADPNITDEEGKTPLQSALDYPTEKNVETIKFLKEITQSTQTDKEQFNEDNQEKIVSENNQENNYMNESEQNCNFAYLKFFVDNQMLEKNNKRKFDDIEATPPSPILQSPSNGYY